MPHKLYGSSKKSAPAHKRKSLLPLYLLGGALALIIVGVFVLLRGPAAPSGPIEVAGKPKLAVDREQIDFGKVPLDRPVRADFELSNVGDEPLELLAIPTVEVKEGC